MLDTLPSCTPRGGIIIDKAEILFNFSQFPPSSIGGGAIIMNIMSVDPGLIPTTVGYIECFAPPSREQNVSSFGEYSIRLINDVAQSFLGWNKEQIVGSSLGSVLGQMLSTRRLSLVQQMLIRTAFSSFTIHLKSSSNLIAICQIQSQRLEQGELIQIYLQKAVCSGSKIDVL